MKNKILIIIYLIIYSVSFGQNKSKEINSDFYKSIPQEKIYTHVNSNFLLSGETLLYKIYCLNKLTNIKSKLSKLAYVELINKDKISIIKQKIFLSNGAGNGEIFIKPEYITGNYKLIVYTKWMQNQDLYFETDLAIINPFLNKISNNKSQLTHNKNVVIGEKGKNSTISTNKNIFNKRDKVTIKLNDVIAGDYSLSVKKIDPQIFSKQTSLNYTNSSNNINKQTDSIFLPDFRGNLIQGKIFSTNNNHSVSNLRVGLSVIQKEGFFKFANTKKDGTFYFNLSEQKYNDKIFLQVLDNINYTDSLQIKLLNNRKFNSEKLAFSDIKTDSIINKIIDDRSKYLQIENAYNNVKKDSIISKKREEFFKGYNFKTFKLDNYTRFESLKETMTEIVNGAWIRKKGNDYEFRIRQINKDYLSELPLIIIDGFIIKNHSDLVEINTKKINKISLDFNTHIFNSKIYEGIIYIETFSGNYEPINKKNIYTFNLLPENLNKNKFKQVYTENNKKTRIPDYRLQLYWNPNINNHNKELTFYTSDVTGLFEIVIDGYSNNGIPFYSKKIIEVK